MRLFVTAHRGATGAEPEHTLAAYEAAIGKGCDAVEICTRLSADGVAVVRRLAYLDDDTDLTGPVHALAWAELATARVGPQERPLSRLSDVVAALDGRTDLEIQLKSTEPELVDAVLAALEGADQDRAQITSVHAALLARAAAANPEVIRCLLIPPTASWARLDLVVHEAVQRARLARADAVHLRPDQITPKVLEVLDRASLSVHVLDADDPGEVDRLVRLGLNRFCTNDLDALLAWRDASR